jgi:hypothetical protein
MEAYHRGQGQMLMCALSGIGGSLGPCNASKSADAMQGFATLRAAEADHSITINLQFGSAGGSPGTNYPSGPNARQVTIDPTHSAFGPNYDLPAVVLHEVHESYSALQIGNPALNASNYLGLHGPAVRYAEDPALLGRGLQSRTSRSVNCSVGPRPLPFGSPTVCQN